MSVFTSLVTSVIPVPGDSPNSITIRKLAPKHLKEARDIVAEARAAEWRKTMREMMDIGGPAVISELQNELRKAMGLNAKGDDVADAEAPSAQSPANPLADYDVVTLLRHGVIGWSYERERTVESYEDMDEDVRDAVATEILRLTKPDLFQAPEEATAEQKNG